MKRRSSIVRDRAKSEHRPVQIFLQSVQLERFKAAFRPDPLAVEPFTVLVGRNGSGKSTLLEALQWLDLTMRHDAVRACERYSGIHDLLNIRSRGQNTRYFKLALEWTSNPTSARAPSAKYELRVNESLDGRPLVHSESLVVQTAHGVVPLIETTTEGSRTSPGRRLVLPRDQERKRIFDEPDRLALSRIAGGGSLVTTADQMLEAIRAFWDRAVFLRLSPQRLAQGSLPKRRSFDPLLDEEGQSLPALLNELSLAQRKALVDAMNVALPDIRKIEVSQSNSSREQNIYWSVREKMPTGYAGKGSYEIPASMLSEGTRRLTAILALLIRRPAPTLLCIEEIENGLDPWTVLDVLARLRLAPKHGTQTILTSHSPWLLDNIELDAIRLVRRKGGNTRYSVFRSEAAVKRFTNSVPPGARYVNLVQSE